MANLTPTEAWRKAADLWVEADEAARLLEDTKSSVLAKWMADMGDVPVSRAEQAVKATDRWHDYVKKVVSARTRAERAKIEMRYRDMLRMDEVSREATHRAEARL